MSFELTLPEIRMNSMTLPKEDPRGWFWIKLMASETDHVSNLVQKININKIDEIGDVFSRFILVVNLEVICNVEANPKLIGMNESASKCTNKIVFMGGGGMGSEWGGTTVKGA